MAELPSRGMDYISSQEEHIIERAMNPGECFHLTRSFIYFQPSIVYSQALVGATDKADMTVCTPAKKAENYFPRKSIIQAIIPNVILASQISLKTEIKI